MTQLCSWPPTVARCNADSTPITFSVGGVIVGVRDTTTADPAHPALLVVVEIGGDFCRIAVPPAVWPAPRELLAIGQFVGVQGTTDSSPVLHGSRQVATEIRLVGTYH
jgi:hypothetical protein